MPSFASVRERSEANRSYVHTQNSQEFSTIRTHFFIGMVIVSLTSSLIDIMTRRGAAAIRRPATMLLPAFSGATGKATPTTTAQSVIISPRFLNEKDPARATTPFTPCCLFFPLPPPSSVNTVR